jgi:hypothetical protein
MMQCWCLYKTAEGYHIMFCAFEKILELKASKKRCWEQQLVDEKEKACHLTKTGSHIEKLVLFCESHI